MSHPHFPEFPLDFMWILWGRSRKERSYFVFHIVEVHSDVRRLEYKEKKEEEEEMMITPGLLISLWAPLAQSVSLQSSLQPSPPSHTRSSSVMPTRALSARVCYARRERDLTISSLWRQPRRSHCYDKVSFHSRNPQRKFAQWYMNYQYDLKAPYAGKCFWSNWEISQWGRK